ncbi:sensor histidine kinase [Poseidonibacter lekithochrous]|uniref:sensor histidine kinase n=1 Tax=Poseidonibacter lekithochrous TaxID=1904463 RepID=UPI000D3CCC5E|nr:cache domain-containing protein [Poseidonibacter lekithochrous]
MENTKEKQILKIIKYTPPIFTIIISILITLFLYFDNKNTFLEQKTRIENDYIKNHKKIIKDEVDRVANYIEYLQVSTEKELKSSIKNRVYEAHSIATNIYNKHKNTKTKKEIFQEIKTALESIRYNNGRGYFFMDNVDGVKVLYPLDKNIENKNFYNYADAKGYKFVRTIVETIKNKTERFDEYYWYKPNQGKESFKKISFYKYFEPLNLAIGSGEYIDEYEKMMQRKALDYINLIRYGKNGYVFVIDYDSIYLSHIKKEYLGKSAIANNDTKKITKVIDDLKNIAIEGSGFYSYVQNSKPDTSLATKKISYVKGFNKWKWIVGTGFYEDDILTEVQKSKDVIDEKYNSYIQNILLLSAVMTLVLLFISMYISKLLEDKLNEYKSEINNKQTLLFQQSKMAAMGEMIGNIAHQWRQPLSTITTASSGMVLQKQLDALSDDFFYEASNKINASAQYLSKTIDDFRNFFSPNKVKSNFLLKNTFSTALDLIQAQFKTKSINIVKHIENVEIISYENELIQALINILNNARDELLKVDDHSRFIFIDVYKKDDKINICVKDSAGGIPNDIINRIFEPYFTTKHKAQGTGIGLYMTEEIIVKHLEGELFVRNKDFIYQDKPLRGAEFKIILPIDGDLI